MSGSKAPNGRLEQWVVSMNGCIRDGKFDRTSDATNEKKSQINLRLIVFQESCLKLNSQTICLTTKMFFR